MLDAITLDLPAGCMIGIIGPDGVGKSSLFSLIAGARAIQTGRIEVLGGDMADAQHRRTVCPRIAYMPQGLGKNLYPTLVGVRERRLLRHGFSDTAAASASGASPICCRPPDSPLSPTAPPASCPAA